MLVEIAGDEGDVLERGGGELGDDELEELAGEVGELWAAVSTWTL